MRQLCMSYKVLSAKDPSNIGLEVLNKIRFSRYMNTNLDTVLKTGQIIFVYVVLKLKPQHTVSCVVFAIMPMKPPL